MAILLFPLSNDVRDCTPIATLRDPVVALLNAELPIATFSSPAAKDLNALLPMAEFLEPVEEYRAYEPMALLSFPVVLE